MNEENMSQLTFYVVEAEPTVSSPDGVATIPGQDTELQSLSALRRWFRPEAKEVPADKLLESFEKTRANRCDDRQARGQRTKRLSAG